MPKLGRSSFRRVLLSRILLLSIPVLLAGEFAAYKKFRSGLLESAQQNLTESAVRKGENIRDLVEATRATLVTASEALSSQPDVFEKREFASQMARWLPSGLQCVQLMDVRTSKVLSSNCGNDAIAQNVPDNWKDRSQVVADPRTSVRITPVLPLESATEVKAFRQLSLVFSAPIYERGQLRYMLSVQSALYRQESNTPGSLSGYTIVIDRDGTILAHPVASRIGRNLRQEPYADVVENALNQAIAGNQDFLAFEENGAARLAGYSPIQLPMSQGETRTWLVLAVAPMENALYGLAEIRQVLGLLTLGLVVANLLAALYLARDLALPMEKLGNYALHIQQRHPSERAPKDFKIKELNQLAVALDSMVAQLEERAEELEDAWQEAQAANQLKSDFLATTSHELRTPLNAIIGCIRLVKDGCCDSRDEELEFLQQADEAAIHLLKIINDLLDIAKIEAGKVELNLQPVSIQDLCQQCLKMVQPGAEKKRLALALDVEAGLGRVPLDERRVRQMVINLLSNAVKFTPEGGSVRLRGRIGYGEELAKDIRPDDSPVSAETPYLCLEVVDSGIGIPQERWHLLFRPFQQVDSSLTRKHEGTGLGLALTKRLAELHGGTISFQSTPGKGSTFRIWLPSTDVPGSDRNGRNLEPTTAPAMPPEVLPDRPPAYPLPTPEQPAIQKFQA